jgi:hypothetical protein
MVVIHAAYPKRIDRYLDETRAGRLVNPRVWVGLP